MCVVHGPFDYILCPDCEWEASGVHPDAEKWAQRFHEVYEELAPEYGYETRVESRKPWENVPEKNRWLMVAVVSQILREWEGR